MPQIFLKRVSKDYRQEQERRVFHAVQDVDLSIDRGEFVFITGSSGAGKSTLLQLICAELKPTKGHVYYNGVNLSRLTQRQRDRYRLRFGYVPQLSTLIRKRTIQENLLTVAEIAPRQELRPEERVRKALALVGMSDALYRYPVELSLGECRRVELARAIINNPEVLVLDELTANLDEDTAWDMFLFLSEVNHHGITVIMASHAKNFVNLMRRRVITLVDGKIFGDVERGRYGDVM